MESGIMGWSILISYSTAFGGGRWICECECGRGIATLGEARTACHGGPPLIGGSTMDVEGEDVFEDNRL